MDREAEAQHKAEQKLQRNPLPSTINSDIDTEKKKASMPKRHWIKVANFFLTQRNRKLG